MSEHDPTNDERESTEDESESTEDERESTEDESESDHGERESVVESESDYDELGEQNRENYKRDPINDDIVEYTNQFWELFIYVKENDFHFEEIESIYDKDLIFNIVSSFIERNIMDNRHGDHFDSERIEIYLKLLALTCPKSAVENMLSDAIIKNDQFMIDKILNIDVDEFEIDVENNFYNCTQFRKVDLFNYALFHRNSMAARKLFEYKTRKFIYVFDYNVGILLAARSNNIEIAKLIIRRVNNFYISIKDYDALTYTMHHGNLEFFKLLLIYGNFSQSDVEERFEFFTEMNIQKFISTTTAFYENKTS